VSGYEPTVLPLAKALLLVWCTSLAIAGCGTAANKRSDEPKSDTGAAGPPLTRALSGSDRAAKCEQVVTPQFVAEIYGSVVRCRMVEANPDKEPATDVRVGATKVTGDRPIATVTLVGGLTPGASGHVELARSDGGWKLDRLGTDRLRAETGAHLMRQIRMTASRPGLQQRVARSCVEDGISRIPERTFRNLASATIAQDEGGSRRIGSLIVLCLGQSGTGPHGQSYLRAQLENQIASLVRRDGGSAADVACVRRRTRAEISDAEIIQHISRQKSAPPAATRHLSSVVAACAG
jgi:hypothetical protein